MGETSGEIIAPPQAVETKEAIPNFGLSVNGSQLIALANLDHLKEYGFREPRKPNLLDRLRAIKYRPALQKLKAIEELVLKGKTHRARMLLQQGLTLVNPVHRSEDLIKEAIDSLSANISVKEALKNQKGIYEMDATFREFVQSLPGKPLEKLPKEYAIIFLTQLGAEAYINPGSNLLTLPVHRFMRGPALLPLDQQHPFYIEEGDVIGKEGKETTLVKLEVFAELAKRYPKVFTHVARKDKLPIILQTGEVGKDYGYGKTEQKGLYVETLTFKDSAKYDRAIESLRSGNEITIPSDELNAHNYPFHELTYVNPENIFPIAIFSDQLPQEHKIKGWIIDGAIDIKDKCLVGIWVTPQYKEHLLNWVSTWTEEKRKKVFGERKPEDVLISSAKDLPRLEE